MLLQVCSRLTGDVIGRRLPPSEQSAHPVKTSSSEALAPCILPQPKLHKLPTTQNVVWMGRTASHKM